MAVGLSNNENRWGGAGPPIFSCFVNSLREKKIWAERQLRPTLELTKHPAPLSPRAV